jgi:hypothetical protein
MALLDILALLDATSIYRGAIIHIGNAPATSDGPSRSSCLCFVIERDGVKLMTRRIARCGSCWHPLWRSRLALRRRCLSTRPRQASPLRPRSTRWRRKAGPSRFVFLGSLTDTQDLAVGRARFAMSLCWWPAQLMRRDFAFDRFTVEPSQQGVRLIPINRSTPRVADEQPHSATRECDLFFHVVFFHRIFFH